MVQLVEMAKSLRMFLLDKMIQPFKWSKPDKMVQETKMV